MFKFLNKKFSIYSETEKWLKEKDVLHSAAHVTTSTNEKAKEEAFLVNESPKVYLTDNQISGRGRGKNLWHNSLAGDSLLCTWSLHMQSSPQAITGPLMGLSLYTSLQMAFAIPTLNIKPPNDIYLGNHKLLGLLVENVQSGESSRLIIGVGLNVFSHPQEIQTAGHLSTQVKVTKKKWRIFLESLSNELFEAARASQAQHLTESQRNRLLFALNLHPTLSEKYTSVSPFGDLITRQKSISWRDL